MHCLLPYKLMQNKFVCQNLIVSQINKQFYNLINIKTDKQSIKCENKCQLLILEPNPSNEYFYSKRCSNILKTKLVI